MAAAGIELKTNPDFVVVIVHEEHKEQVSIRTKAYLCLMHEKVVQYLEGRRSFFRVMLTLVGMGASLGYWLRFLILGDFPRGMGQVLLTYTPLTAVYAIWQWVQYRQRKQSWIAVQADGDPWAWRHQEVKRVATEFNQSQILSRIESIFIMGAIAWFAYHALVTESYRGMGMAAGLFFYFGVLFLLTHLRRFWLGLIVSELPTDDEMEW